MELRDDFIWCQKYRPRTIEDCILPRGLKDTFLEFVSNGDIPRLTILIHNRHNLHFVGLLKSSLRTVDLSLLVISKIVSLNRFIVGVVLLIFAFPRRIARSSQ